jgi:hypothetical protein
MTYGYTCCNPLLSARLEQEGIQQEVASSVQGLRAPRARAERFGPHHTGDRTSLADKHRTATETVIPLRPR